MRKNYVQNLLLVVSIILSFSIANAQEDETELVAIDEVEELIDEKIEDVKLEVTEGVMSHLKKKFKFGMSFGPRFMYDDAKYRAIAKIEPIGNTVQIEYEDVVSLYLSTSLVIYPWEDSELWSHVGFVANLNLIEFGDDENSVTVEHL